MALWKKQSTGSIDQNSREMKTLEGTGDILTACGTWGKDQETVRSNHRGPKELLAQRSPMHALNPTEAL